LIVFERISNARHKRERVRLKCNKRVSRLTIVGKRGEADQLSELLKAKVKFVPEGSKATLNKKLCNLKEQQRGKLESSEQKKTVINLSNRVLSETEKSVLERGLNFSVAPSKVPKFEIIKSIETAAVRLAPGKAEAYRAKIKSAIEKCKEYSSPI
jgi:hypothetical protein